MFNDMQRPIPFDRPTAPPPTTDQLKASLQALDAAVQRRQADLETARQAEREFIQAVAAINARVGELCARFGILKLADNNAYTAILEVAGDEPPPAVSAEVEQLHRRRRQVEQDRAEWLAGHRVRTLDVQWRPSSVAMTVVGCQEALRHATAFRDGVRDELQRRLAAEAEALRAKLG